MLYDHAPTQLAMSCTAREVEVTNSANCDSSLKARAATCALESRPDVPHEPFAPLQMKSERILVPTTGTKSNATEVHYLIRTKLPQSNSTKLKIVPGKKECNVLGVNCVMNHSFTATRHDARAAGCNYCAHALQYSASFVRVQIIRQVLVCKHAV